MTFIIIAHTCTYHTAHMTGQWVRATSDSNRSGQSARPRVVAPTRAPMHCARLRALHLGSVGLDGTLPRGEDLSSSIRRPACAPAPHGRAHGWRRFCAFETPPRPPATAPPRPQPSSHRMDLACTGGGRIQHSASAGKHQESGLAQADQRIMGTESAEHARRRGGGAGMRAAKVSSAHLMKRYVENPTTGAEEQVDLACCLAVSGLGALRPAEMWVYT